MSEKTKALEFFKDWSNYLLVTTVAALGWSSTANVELLCPWDFIAVWSFATSIVFGILTLAMIPLIAESLTDKDESFYQVKGTFKLLWLWGPEVGMRIKVVCWPQHVAFLAGILTYAIGATR